MSTPPPPLAPRLICRTDRRVPTLSFHTTATSQKRSVDWEERLLSALNMAALRLNNAKARASSSSSTATAPNVDATKEEEGAKKNHPPEGKTRVATTDSPSTAVRGGGADVSASAVGGVIPAGVDQDVPADTVKIDAPAAAACTAAGAGAASTAVDTDPSTSRDPPQLSRRTDKGCNDGARTRVGSDYPKESVTSYSSTPPQITRGNDKEGLPATRTEEDIKGGDNGGQASPQGKGGGDENKKTQQYGKEGADDERKAHKKEKEGMGNGGQEKVKPEEATFVMVAKEHLVGTWLAVFVRASMLKQVSDVRSGKGWMGVIYVFS